METAAQQEEIVIVGGGICGLATALAFHRKGIRSRVLEKSETLRTTGVGIIIQSNGWRALDHLGVASMLRNTALCIHSGIHTSLGNCSKTKELPMGGEIRCLKRIDLVKALASDLPLDTIQFGKHVISIQEDPITSYPVLHLQDGSVVRPKIVIGCDGVNSIISTILGPYSTKLSPTSVVRGFSYVRNGHDYGSTYHVFSNIKHVKIGIFPVTSELIYWFVIRRWTSEDSKISRDRMLIKESTVELLKNFPQEIVELIEYSDLESLHLTDLRYRSPWEVLTTNFRKGTMTVAGDAMHAMCPFLAQAGSASLEDAVVLARCLGEKLQSKAIADTRVKEMVEEGIDEYLNKRKMRVFWLCLQTDLVGRVIQPSSLPMKLLSVFLLTILFSDPNQHTRYDCCES